MATLFDRYTSNIDGDSGFANSPWAAQTFTPAVSFTITSVKLKGHRVSTHWPGNIIVSIRATSAGVPTGDDINGVTGTFDGDTLTDDHWAPEKYEVVLSSGIALTAGVKYAIICRGTTGGTMHWNMDYTAPTYSGGATCSSGDLGLTWTEDDTRDFYFECWGTPTETAVVFVVGTRDSSRVGLEASVWAYNENGELQWRYDTAGDTAAVISDPSGNIYIVGTAADNGDGNGTRNLWKLNSSGSYLGGRYVNSASFGYDVCLDSVGRIIVGTSVGAWRVAVDLASEVVISSSLAWVAVAVDSQDNIYIGGSYVKKYNSASPPVLQWSKSPSEGCSSLAVMDDDSIVGAFLYTSKKVWHYPAVDGGVGNEGDWQSEDVSDGGGEFGRIALDSNDNIYVVVYNNPGITETRLVKLNSTGAVQWKTTHEDDLQNIFINNSDVVHAVGTRYGSVAGWKEISQSLMDVLQVPSTALKGVVGTSDVDLVPARIKVDYYVIGGVSKANTWDDTRWEGQTFTPNEDYTATSVKLLLSLDSSISETITVSIRATSGGKPTGLDLCSGTLSTNNIGVGDGNKGWHEITFGAGAFLTNGIKYAICVRSTEVAPTHNIGWWIDITSPTYTNGNRVISNNIGVDWSETLSDDFMFEVLKNYTISPVITDQSTDSTVVVGEETILSVTATGNPAPTYQWYENDVIMSGETNSTLTIYPTVTSTYKCIVTNVAGSDESNPIIITVVRNPYAYNLFSLPIDISRID